MMSYEHSEELAHSVEQAKAELVAGVEKMSPRLATELWRSAEELQRIFENNPERNVRSSIDGLLKQRAMSIDFDRMSAGLFRDLEAAGYNPPSLEHLADSRYGDLGALPILLDWFDKTDESFLRQKIMWAVGSWAFPQAIPLLFERFHRIDPADDPHGYVRGEILRAMSRHIRAVDRQQWAAIAADPAQHDVHDQALEGISNLRKRPDDLVEFVEGFLSDPNSLTATAAAEALGRWRVVEALPAIQRLADEIEARNARADESEIDYNTDRLEDVIKKLRKLKS